MQELLREARESMIKEFVKQRDNEVLFDIWYGQQLEMVPIYSDTLKPDKRVLKFIFDVFTAYGITNDIVRQFFHAGYCYYFAIMLQDAFPGGHIMWAKPYGHICYMYQGLPYDVEGLYSGDGELVPYEELGDTMESFRHRGMDEDLRHEMEDFAEEHDMDFEYLCEVIYELVPEDKRVADYPMGTAMKYFREYKSKL